MHACTHAVSYSIPCNFSCDGLNNKDLEHDGTCKNETYLICMQSYLSDVV